MAAPPPPAVQPPKPEPKPIDVAGALAQQVLSIKQSKAVPLSQLFVLVEEMAGVPIKYDSKELGAAAAALDDYETLDLRDTTVAEILRVLVEKAGLQYDIQTDGIHLYAPNGS